MCPFNLWRTIVTPLCVRYAVELRGPDQQPNIQAEGPFVLLTTGVSDPQYALVVHDTVQYYRL